MKKIKLFPAPHIEVRIHVSDQMAADMKRCQDLAALPGDGADCSQCSWEDVQWEGTGMCELPAIIEILTEVENEG